MSKGLGEERFKRVLLSSHALVKKTAEWLRRKGEECRVTEISEFASSHAEQSNYSDDGDIWTPSGRIEVKGLSIDFTGAHDWPYGSMMIVDQSYQIDRYHSQELRAYINWNKQQTHIAWIPGSSKTQWSQQKKWDRRYKKECIFYRCPISVAKWIEYEPAEQLDALSPEKDVNWIDDYEKAKWG